MKRKLLALLTTLLLLATMVTPAFADVLWMPRGNNFFETHDCAVHNRSYLANGGDGYVTVRIAPDALTQVVNLANGTRFFVVYTWEDEDGSLWGLGYPSGQWEQEGWVHLADMALIYDYISFDEDHSHEYQKYDGSGDHVTEDGHQQKAQSYEPDLYQVPVCRLPFNAGIPDTLHHNDAEEQSALEVGCCISLQETVYDRILVKGRCRPFAGYR